MKRKNQFSINVGTSSILFIFVILCLVSFSILSLVSANADYKLSKKVADNTTAYYDACNQAEEMIAQTDSTLSKLYADGISRSGYFEKVGKKKSFAFPVSDIQTLEVEIRILYPTKTGDPFYEISSWQIVTTGNLEYDDSLPVIK